MIDRSGTDDRLTALTARQVQVLALMAAGRSNAAIAARLAITEKAVVRHATDALGPSIVTPNTRPVVEQGTWVPCRRRSVR